MQPYLETPAIIVTYIIRSLWRRADSCRAVDGHLCALQGKGAKTFRDLMDYAVLNGFDKALASCEHCIVTDVTGRFNQIMQHMPPESKRRIVRCLRQTCTTERPYLNPEQLTPWTTADFLPHKFHLGLTFKLGLGLGVEGYIPTP